MAALRSLMVASSVAFALACQEVGSSIDQATRLPDVMSDKNLHVCNLPDSIPDGGQCMSVGTCTFQLDIRELGTTDFVNDTAPFGPQERFVIGNLGLILSSIVSHLQCGGRSIHVCSEDAYAASLYGGSIGGIVVGILVIVLMSLPLCCGVLKQYGKAGKISGANSWLGP